MEPWQERVVAEKAELDERLGKLSKFVYENAEFWKICEAERSLLRRQLTVMDLYSRILGERIEGWSNGTT
jgi:hypothetical protein